MVMVIHLPSMCVVLGGSHDIAALDHVTHVGLRRVRPGVLPLFQLGIMFHFGTHIKEK